MAANGLTSFDFSMKEKNALVIIYKEDIKAALRDVPFLTALDFFADSFDASEIKRTISEATKGNEAGKDEICRLASKAHDPRVFVRLVELISKYDTALANKLRCVGLFDVKHYQNVLAVYPTFNLLADAEFVSCLVVACSSNCCSTAAVCELVLNILVDSEGSVDQSAAYITTVRALSVFLQHLPHYNAEWYWLFMQALDSVPNGRQLRDAISADFEEQLKEWNVIDTKKSFEEWLRRQEGASDAGDSSSSNNDDNESLAGTVSTEGPVSLRQYQLELASAAAQGRNAVICAPTGSGKTYVAAEITRRHFVDGKISGSKAKKAAFLVPTVQLVDQQYAVLKSYLPSNLKIKLMKGGTTTSAMAKAPKAETVLTSDVVVTTPQVLLNVLRDTSLDGTVKVTLSSISLLIFDECHHTDKDHPYNEIMVQYLDTKFEKPSDAFALPQIVGLTASLGVGKADDEKKALEHVVRLSANMDAHVLLTVSEEHRAELADLVNVPVDRVVTVKEPPHPLAILIERVMEQIEKLVELDFRALKPQVAALSLANGASLVQVPVTVQPPARRAGPQYTGWVCTWLARLPEITESQTKPKLTSALEHLRIYTDALELNGHVPPEQALVYLRDRLNEFERKQSSDRDRQLVHMYKEDILAKTSAHLEYYTKKNMLVEKLTEILSTEFREKPDARVLVFVRTRDLTLALENYMKGDKRLVLFNAARLTGVQASKERGGQTTSEQQDLLERFRNGHHKILVATTVAEEGLDVEKCHLIIKYNHVTNEIAMVQRRGRGRAVGSECILLVKDGWIEEKESINVLREDLMHRAVNIVQAKGKPWFRGTVEQMQKSDFEKRAIDRALAAQLRHKSAGKCFQMLCKKCDSFIISTKDVRQVVRCHYVGVDPSIWQRVCLEPNNQPRIFENMVQAGKISCSKCRNDCGIIIRYSNAYLPGLKMAALTLKQIGGGQRLSVKQWTQAVPRYFNVDEVANSDLRDMFDAVDQQSRNDMDSRL